MSEAQASGTSDHGGIRTAHPPIVVIGASAGGIKALQAFFEDAPPRVEFLNLPRRQGPAARRANVSATSSACTKQGQT